MRMNLTVILMSLSIFGDDTKPTRVLQVLGPDDSINVLALNCEEISKEWRIGATGDVTFPMIGRIHLAGLTVDQVDDPRARRAWSAYVAGGKEIIHGRAK